MKHINSIFLVFFFGFILFAGKPPGLNVESPSEVQTYRFILTHLLGKKLEKAAYFNVGSTKVWELDFRNGDRIKYNILSMNSDNPMCGITAKDSFGDICEICITKLSGDNTKVEFKYYGKRVTYSGYLDR